jgi:ubiquitin carboxyl-terminal hydrolase 36/42
LQLEEQAAMKSITNAKTEGFSFGKKTVADNSNSKNNDHNKAVVSHFRHLVDSVWSVSHNKPISPRGLISSIKRVGKQFKPFRQEDAHEYLRQLLDCMHEEVLKANRIRTSDGKVAETSFISRIFGGYLCNMLTCTKCGYISKTFNHFQDLSLDISGRIDSVSRAIDAFTKPEVLTAGNEWHCDKCKTRVKV